VVAPPRSARRGFLLVDVLVGAVLLGIALAAILTVSMRALSVQRQAADLRRAAMVADEVMGVVHAFGYEDYERVIDSSGPAPAPHERYAYEVDVDENGTGAAADVAVTARWRSATGSPRSFILEAMIAPRLGEEPDPNRTPPEPVDR